MREKNQPTDTPPVGVGGVVLYVLAGVVLALGGYAGLTFANAPAALSTATIAFRSPALSPLWDAIGSGLRFTGALLFGVSLILSALLVAGARVLRRSATLAQRVGRLEAALERANIALDGAAGSAPREVARS